MTFFTVLLGALLLAAFHAQSQGYSNPYYYEPGISNGAIFISGYTGTASDLILPTNLLGYTVTGIANNAFNALTSLTNVTIPATVTYMGTEAFAGCTNLSSITLPDTITDLAQGLFAGDSSLTNILIPNGVTNIADYVFQNCGGLRNLILPQGIPSIGVSEFSYCTNLTALTIPNSVTGISFLAFQYSGLTSITIPDGVTNIGNEAFCYSPNLARVTIGSGVTGMGVEVFSFCPALTAFQVDSNNTAFMSADGVLFDRNGTLIQYPPSRPAASYILPDSVTTIGLLAFQSCANLSEVTLDDNLTNITGSAFGYVGGAFSYCSHLKQITIPDSVTSIGTDAFVGCAELSSVSIGRGLGTIEGGTFAGCSSLVSATLSDGVTNIAYLAFARCPKLSAVYFEGNAPAVDLTTFTQDTVTVYYRPGTTGWAAFSSTAGVRVAPWLPQFAVGPGFGIQSNQFGFDISAPPNTMVTVQACTDLAHPVWTNLNTVTITNGTLHFSEPAQLDVAGRFYRLSWQ